MINIYTQHGRSPDTFWNFWKLLDAFTKILKQALAMKSTVCAKGYKTM